MRPCTGCRRHVRAAESRCPFCGAALVEGPAPAVRGFVVGLAVFGAACGPGKPEDTDGAASSSDSTATTSTSTTTGVAPTTGASSTGADTTQCASCGDSSSAGGFIYGSPDGGTTVECDVWLQDCPEGQKCAPASLDGDSSWESLICVDVAPNPDKVGDACTAEGASGVDSCEKGAMCWNVSADTGKGTCIEQCKGSEQAPTCTDPFTECVISGSGVLTLCLSRCDPLAQDCPNSSLCIPDPMSFEGFVCALDASGVEGQEWDPCDSVNACDPGLFCADSAEAEECDQNADGCCLPFCDTTVMPDPCMGVGQACLPFFAMGMAPPGLENVGACGIP